MKITEKGQVTIPKAIRERYGLRPGSQIQFIERDHRVVLEKAGAGDVWERYRGFLKVKKGTRTDDLIRAMRGPGPHDHGR